MAGAGTLLAASLLLQGCLVAPAHTPAHSDLCVDQPGNDTWTRRGMEWSSTAQGVDYDLAADDNVTGEASARPVAGMHWVRIEGATGGRGVGMRAPAMIYDPRDAVLEMDGQHIHALPRLWHAELDGLYRVGSEVDVPHNLNTMSDHSPDAFYIAFPWPRSRSAEDVYSVRLGTLLLDGVRVQIPVATSCFSPARTWLAPIH